jgi:hypothetical protein
MVARIAIFSPRLRSFKKFRAIVLSGNRSGSNVKQTGAMPAESVGSFGMNSSDAEKGAATYRWLTPRICLPN